MGVQTFWQLLHRFVRMRRERPVNCQIDQIVIELFHLLNRVESDSKSTGGNVTYTILSLTFWDRLFQQEVNVKHRV
jgi:hypothetical protein